MNSNKSIEELENDFWKELEVYPTGLVKRCFDYRKIPVNDLTPYQIQTLISQNIGTEFLLNKLLMFLEVDILTEGIYVGGLLEVSLKIDYNIWQNNKTQFDLFVKLIYSNKRLIESELGDGFYSSLLEFITR